MRRRLTFPFLLSLAALIGIACGDEFEQKLKPKPVFVRSISPADSVLLNSYDPFDVSVTFNRTVDLGELRMELFPEPARSGPLTSTGSGRNVTWFAVSPEPASRAHRLLLDGRRMTQPVTLTLYTPGQIPRALFSGKVVSEDPSKVSPLGAVVFALDLNSPFNPLEPESFDGIKPVQFDVVEGTDLQGNGPYAMPHLVEKSKYIVVAIFDSNADAIYDPAEDWWGFYGNELANDPDTVVAYVPSPDRGNPEKPQPETRVDIKLRAPR